MVKKSFNEKLNDSKDLPKVIEVTDPKSVMRFGGTKMLIAPPLFYDEVIRKIPSGKITTTNNIRDYLAKKNNADFTCPLTAGIFINICAMASLERGNDETPYWRVLKKDGELNEKFPNGISGHKSFLKAEGHTIIQKGKKYFVKDYESKMFNL